MRYALGIMVAAALAGCSGGDDDAEERGTQTSEEMVTRPELTADRPIPTEPTGWIKGAGGPASESLSYSDGTGGLLLSLACLADPARLQVTAPRLTPIESEERLTLGVGDRLAVMVAGPATRLGGSGSGVTAEAPLDANLVAAMSGGDFAVSYGADIIEIDQPPADDLLTSFANGCEAALAADAADAEQEG